MNPLQAEKPCTILRMLGCMLYDGVVLIAILFAITAITLVLRSGAVIAPGSHAFQLFLLMAAWLYFAYSWRIGGQTLGMRAWQVQLRSHSGSISWRQSMLRFLVAILSLLCFGMGYFWALLHPAGMTWHDLASGTWLVTRKRI